MSPLLVTVVAASAVGSLHCAGMCGPFVVMACQCGGKTPTSRAALISYHAGRLVTYLVLGAMAGLAGATMTLAGDRVGIVQAAAVVAGLAMLTGGVISILRLSGVGFPRLPVPGFLVHRIHGVFKTTARWNPTARALAIGVASTWLPCGWLYGFVLVAAGAGSLGSSLLVMAAFWIGNVPLLSLLGWGSQQVGGRWRTAVPWVSAAVMLFAGTHLLATRAFADFKSFDSSIGASAATSERLDRVTSTRPPCCHAR